MPRDEPVPQPQVPLRLVPVVLKEKKRRFDISMLCFLDRLLISSELTMLMLAMRRVDLGTAELRTWYVRRRS